MWLQEIDITRSLFKIFLKAPNQNYKKISINPLSSTLHTPTLCVTSSVLALERQQKMCIEVKQ